MWTKTVTTTFQKKPIQVLTWFSASGDKQETVTIQSMLNEYFLMEKVVFETRDAAYDFIKDYTPSMANSFIKRTAYNAGAVE